MGIVLSPGDGWLFRSNSNPNRPRAEYGYRPGHTAGLQDAESIPALNALETDDLAIVEVIDQMCPIAAGQHKPTVELGDLTENEYIQDEIVEYCSNVRPALFPAPTDVDLNPGMVKLFTLTFERVDSAEDIPPMFEVKGIEGYMVLTYLCAIADGHYEPEISLRDFGVDAPVQAAIHESCATF